jgi:hypothetical protein
MSTFTGSELEFLAGLNKSWWRLYWRELARLLGGENAAFDARQQGGAAIRSNGVVRSPTAKILAFAPRFPACSEDAACPFRRRRNGTDGSAAAALQRRVELAAGKR